MALSPDGKTLAAGRSADARSEVLVWELTEQGPSSTAVTLHVPGRRVLSVAFSPDSKTLASGHRGGIALWDKKESGWQPSELPAVSVNGSVKSVAFRDNNHLARSSTLMEVEAPSAAWCSGTSHGRGDRRPHSGGPIRRS